MGCSDRWDYDPTYEDRQRRTRAIISALQNLPASRFTVAELRFVMQVQGSPFKSGFYEQEHKWADELAARENVLIKEI
jgi:hypothetical protein